MLVLVYMVQRQVDLHILLVRMAARVTGTLQEHSVIQRQAAIQQ